MEDDNAGTHTNNIDKKRKHKYINDSKKNLNNDKINFYQNLLYDIENDKRLLKINKLNLSNIFKSRNYFTC